MQLTLNRGQFMKTTLRYTTGLALALMLVAPSHAADIWQNRAETAAKSISSEATRSQVSFINSARQLKLNTSAMQFQLNQAPSETGNTTGVELDLPLPDGGVAKFLVYNSPILEQSISSQTPSIQTFRAVDVSNPYNRGRLDMTPAGFHAMFTHNGRTVLIDPIGSNDGYQSYYKSDYIHEMEGHRHAAFTCGVHEYNKGGTAFEKSLQSRQSRNLQARDDVSFGTDLRTYRLAVAATGEYTNFHGGTAELGLAAIVTSVNRINEIYNRDLAINLELVSNNIDVVYTDPDTDPYTGFDPFDLIDEVADDLNANIGEANYDIGHVFAQEDAPPGFISGTGLAALGVVCGPQKAEGVTGSSDPINDIFLVDLVAHEFGHQFAANHSFNGTTDNCDQRAPENAFEVGSGTTIMAYAGICGRENVENFSSDFFHAASISEVNTFINNPAFGGSCGVSTTLNNVAPTADAGEDGAIPASTPFTLRGQSSDSDSGDTLTHIWEQFDVGSTTSAVVFRDTGSNPLFRSFEPIASKDRTFPQISDILSGTTTFGEFLPTETRELNFRFTVRDGNGGVTSDTTTLQVSEDAGPFTVTDLSETSLTGNTQQMLEWDVANTTAAPISCETVDINFSTDGGQSFETVVLEGTANDGSQNVTVPNVDTTTGRFQVSCSTQPFFALNMQNLTVASSNTPPPSTNAEPSAAADSFTVDQDSSNTSFAVLNNDTDSDGDTLTVTGVSGFSAGGSATFGATNVVYTPAAGFSGTETFTYEVSDGNGGTSSAQVTVTVTEVLPPNTEPVAVDDSFTVDQDSAATLFAVLNNDSDSDGDTLSISAVSAPTGGGSATISGADINYQPAAGFSGSETFTYTVADGNDGSATATVTVSVTAAPVVVTPPPGPTPTPPPSSGGGGSVSLFLLMLLALGGMVKTSRQSRIITSAKE